MIMQLRLAFAIAMQMFMTAEIDIAGSESRLRDAGKTIADLCRLAGVAQTTWHRWKTKGHQPRLTSRRAVVAALEELAPIGREAA
jgi:hypothetical protein